MFVKPHLIQTNKAGVTIIELLIYISLLSMLVTVVFSFVWQIHRKNKNILISHTQLHVMQLAIDLLGRDLRNSNKIIINQKNQTGLDKDSIVLLNQRKKYTQLTLLLQLFLEICT